MFCFKGENEWNSEYVFTSRIYIYARNVFKTIWFYWQCLWSIHKKQRKNGKVLQTGNTNFIYKNELDKVCFQHDMAYGKSKDLVKGTQSDKVFRDKAFKIVSDPKYDGYQRGLAPMVYKFFDKKPASLNKSSGSGIANQPPNYQLANKFHEPIIRKL